MPSKGNWFTCKCLACFLVFLLAYGDLSLYPGKGPGNIDETAGALYSSAREYYRNGLYQAALVNLTRLDELKNPLSYHFKARKFLLMGACLEKLGRQEEAVQQYRELKHLVDYEIIDGIPEVPGVNTAVLAQFQKIMGEQEFFAYREPMNVTEVMEGHVIHAPKKSQEIKKKKFPWLWFGIGALVAGITLALILTRKYRVKKTSFPEISWCKVPAGEFSMGDNFGEGEGDEQPLHQVYLDKFHISKFEISRIQYDYYCRDTGRTPLFSTSEGENVYYPAGGISWQEAVGFCAWLSARTGENIHLPTEAQWEKAARGGMAYRYPWGDTAPNCDIANFGDCLTDGRCTPKRVGMLSAGNSIYAVCDMAGNVAEWCRDWYDPGYYSRSPGRNPQGPDQGPGRVIRGGNYCSPALELRSSDRSYADGDTQDSSIGFRVVKED